MMSLFYSFCPSMLCIFFSFYISFMTMFFFISNPLILGLLLILSTFFMSLYCSFFSFSSWNGYILFLMFLGGLLILFLYNISLITTEIFSLNILLLMMPFFFYFSFSFKDLFTSDSKVFLLNDLISPMMFLFSKMNIMSLIFLVLYLFFSLICIVNNIYFNKDKGSFRF